MVGSGIPELEGDARKAVLHRQTPLQIIASAGSGKTEVVSQRVVKLLESGEPPNSIVAFTFTERAAESLKQRVEQRVEARLGKAFIDRLNGCFIGTIHSYCFRLLQEHVTEYEAYDVLDDNKLAAFLTREADRLQLKTLNGKLFSAVPEFIRNIEVVGNELIPLQRLAPPFSDMVERFYAALRNYRFLTYSRLISLSVEQLAKSEVYRSVRAALRHLIVDEYQDINPAQEALIRLLGEPPVEICVVGDDDQSIYQWRGSDVTNIVEFEKRYSGVSHFRLLTNRRSRPTIITTANAFAKTIHGRIPKLMQHHRSSAAPELVAWRANTEAEEAAVIGDTILALKRKGFRYRDVAVLVRSSTSYPRLLEAFEARSIPVQPGGRTGLFKEPDGQTFGSTFAYLSGNSWRASQYGWGSPVTLDTLVTDYCRQFSLTGNAIQQVRATLASWKAEVKNPTGPADLIGRYYDLLSACQVAQWNFDDPVMVARLGNHARCSAILADYEGVRRRSRPDENAPGEVLGGQDRGEWYYRWLFIHIQNWALGAFEGFEGEEDFTLDAVDLTTVHKAKGLEWPVVFVPCVSANRFPSIKTGQAQTWHVPLSAFNRTRYEGTVNDERRLFYVAITRARDWLSVSTHDTPNRQAVAPSDFLLSISGGSLPYRRSLPLPPKLQHDDHSEDILSITFSELANFKACGLAYRLRSLIGFQPSLAPELGYGRAVHHIMRTVAEHTRSHKSPPSPAQLNLMFDEQFYVPAASKPAHRQMKDAARRLVNKYIADYGDDLKRIWAIERPFELHLGNCTITGRADVILDEEDGEPASLAIVDYKTAADPDREYDTQLQIYTNAGRREGLQVRAAYVHDLKAGDRIEVDVSGTSVACAEAEVVSLIHRLRARDFQAHPGTACRGCDVRSLCRFAV
jgi:DNA helicase-2/ATP-dependent DNA helicase PcrA